MMNRSSFGNLTLGLLALVTSAGAFAPLKSLGKASLTERTSFPAPKPFLEQAIIPSESPLLLSSADIFHDSKGLLATTVGTTPALVALLSSLPADAADGGSFFPIASALVAYVHYASLLVAMGCLVTEKITVKPSMSEDEEKRLVFADSVYGVAGLTLFVSGYYRLTEYGKGLDFYLNEPIFWVKMILVSVWGASSFFPTGIIIKRALKERETGTMLPMSEKLASRMTTVINAELLALVTMPLAATLMSRGVLYTDSIPWQVGASLTVLTLGGLGYKYVREALTWEDDVVVEPQE